MTMLCATGKRDRWDASDWVLMALYGGFLLFMLPRTITIRSDDFAYLEVVVHTIRSHMPAISDWFEANNVLFSLTAACVYWLTGNFYLATYGILVAYATGAFVLLNLLTMQASALVPTIRRALVLSVALAPVYLNKSLDFVGVMPAIFFFLLALVFYCRKSWVGFFVFTLCAFLVRETGLMLLALPAGEILRRLFADFREGIRLALRLAPGSFLVLVVAVAVKLSMPLGWVAQRLTIRTFDHFSTAAFIFNVSCGLSIALASLILFRAVVAKFGPPPEAGSRYGIIALLVLAAVAGFLIRTGAMINLEFPLPFKFHSINGYEIAALNIAAAFLGLRVSASLPWKSPLALAQIVAIVVISARGGWWDYYFLEIILLSLLQSVLEQGDAVNAAIPSRTLMSILTAIILCEGIYSFYYKFLVERQRLEIAVLEPHFRRHDVSPQEVTNQPWGFAAWYLFLPFIHENPKAAGASSFAVAFAGGNLFMKVAFSKSSAQLPRCAALETGELRLLGIPQFYAINRCGKATIRPLPISTNRFFPLNNAEWTAYIQEQG